MFRNIKFVSKKNYNETLSIPVSKSPNLIYITTSKINSLSRILLSMLLVILPYILITSNKELIIPFLFSDGETFTGINDVIMRLALIIIFAFISIVFVVAIHETLHVVSYPRGQSSDNVYVIFSLPFQIAVRYSNFGKKWRVVLCYLFPLISISFVTGVVLYLLQSPLSKTFALIILYINLTISCNDIINAIDIFLRVPSKSMIRQNEVLLNSN